MTVLILKFQSLDKEQAMWPSLTLVYFPEVVMGERKMGWENN